MKRVLGLMTCYNRKEKTVRALNHLIQGNPEIEFEFIVADDGSADGTFEALQELPGVTILRGNGNLFYSGGMRLAIGEAKKAGRKYDACLLFNDDVDFLPSAIENLCEKDDSCIWVGPTSDERGNLSYGGVVKTSKWRPKTEIVMADSKEGRMCDTFNANCVLIPWKIFKKLDNMDAVYTHSMGDFDYGFSAGRKGFKIRVSDTFVGACPDNPVSVSWRNTELSMKERLKRKESPKGLPKNEWFHYLNKNYNFITAVIYSVIPYMRILLKK